MKITLPTRSLMSAKFRYTPACATDVRKTWEKFARLQRMNSQATAALSLASCEITGSTTRITER